MPLLVSRSINPSARNRLAQLDEVILFGTEDVTYPSISNHPDIFFCPVDNHLIASSAVPQRTVQQIIHSGVSLEVVPEQPGMAYPRSALFNAMATRDYLIHRTDITQQRIKERCQNMVKIHVNQAYTRCNLLSLDQTHWITSDRGIERALQSHGLTTLYVDPRAVRLEGFPHGFFGGCCGVFGSMLLVNGSLETLGESEQVRGFVEKAGFSLLELHKGALHDIGGIMAC